jgi:hypothetical protein
MSRYRAGGLVVLLVGCVWSLVPEEAEAGLFRRRCRPRIFRSPAATCRPAPVCPTCPTCPSPPTKERSASPTGPCSTGAICIDFKIADVFDMGDIYLYSLYAATECLDTPVLHYDAANALPEDQDCQVSPCECFGGWDVIDVPYDMMPLAGVDEEQETESALLPVAGRQPTRAKVRKTLVDDGFATNPFRLTPVNGTIVDTKIVRVRCMGDERQVKLTRIEHDGAFFNVAWETDEAVTSDLTPPCTPIPGYPHGFVIRVREGSRFHHYTLHLPRSEAGAE